MLNFVTSGLEEMKQKLKRVTGEFIDGGVNEANQAIIDQVREYPERVEHDASNPYQWESERQRRAYFATDGFGRGIPYQRTNELAGGWRVEGTGRGSYVVNDTPYAQYVIGERQQKGHAADGWSRLIADGRGLVRDRGRVLRAFLSGAWKAVRRIGL